LNQYYREYLKFSPGFTLNTAPGEGTCQGKLMYLRDYTYGTVMVVYRGGADGKSMFFQIEAPTGNLGASYLPMDGNWHSIEVHLDVPDQLIEMWLDGSQVVHANSPLNTSMNPTGI